MLLEPELIYHQPQKEKKRSAQNRQCQICWFQNQDFKDLAGQLSKVGCKWSIMKALNSVWIYHETMSGFITKQCLDLSRNNVWFYHNYFVKHNAHWITKYTNSTALHIPSFSKISTRQHCTRTSKRNKRKQTLTGRSVGCRMSSKSGRRSRVRLRTVTNLRMLGLMSVSRLSSRLVTLVSTCCTCNTSNSCNLLQQTNFNIFLIFFKHVFILVLFTRYRLHHGWGQQV